MNDELPAGGDSKPPAGPDDVDWSSHVTVPVWLTGSGRAVSLTIPPDLSPLEVLELVSFLTLRNEAGLGYLLRRMRGPQLVVASGREALELGIGTPNRATRRARRES